jgi:hypothetical protein
MQQSSLFKILKYTSFSKKNLLNVHTNSSGNNWPVLYSLFLNITWQLIENNTGMSRWQENKNLLRKRQTSRPRLKPGSEREVHTSFSRRLWGRVVFSKSVYYSRRRAETPWGPLALDVSRFLRQLTSSSSLSDISCCCKSVLNWGVTKVATNLVPRAFCFWSAKMALASAGHMTSKSPAFGVFNYDNLCV